jgi:hypothetical protein
MSGFDWKSLVSSVAPLLGTAIGGPFGLMAGKVLQETLGVDSEEAAIEQLRTNPDALLKLKAGEQAFASRMKELDITEQQLHAADRDSARKLATSRGILFQAGLTVLFMAGYFGLFYLFFSGTEVVLNDWQRGQVGVLIGVLTASIPQLLAFWFGSSKGSADKTAAMTDRR